jgi:hypothetical protein
MTSITRDGIGTRPEGRADGRAAGRAAGFADRATPAEPDARPPTAGDDRFADVGDERGADAGFDERFVTAEGAFRDTARALLFDIGRSLTCEKRVQNARRAGQADPRQAGP